MRNVDLARDYVWRAGVRIRALDVYLEAESWADAVREAQEAVELALKGLLRAHGVEPPRVHDVSGVLLAEETRFGEELRANLGLLADISKQLRRDRELAFYGAEDLTPSEFYTRADAERAAASARRAHELIRPHVIPDG